MTTEERQKMLDRCEQELEESDELIIKLSREKSRSTLALKGAVDRHAKVVDVMRKIVRGEPVQASIFDQIDNDDE